MGKIRIWVPAGVEAGVVRRQLGTSEPERVMALPMGGQGRDRLQHCVTAAAAALEPGERIVLMGLGGSLSPDYRVGDVLIYQTCIQLSTGEERAGDRPFSSAIQSQLREKLPRRRVDLIRGLTSDRVIWSAAEKQHLGQTHQASGVDMEGWTVLTALAPRGIPIAIVRVVSDSCGGDIPNVGAAIGPGGTFQPWPLVRPLVRQPAGALRLIRGSLVGLWALGRVAQALTGREQP
ncbi:MAG: phosphorylase [Elainellaceae cyanobacterium]